LNVVRSSRNVALLFALLTGAIASAQETDSFAELHERARKAEKDLTTLRADFVETTESSLLADPIVEKGTLVAARPIRVLLRYDEPSAKRVLVDGDQFLFEWPDRGIRERRRIAEMQENVDRYFYRASLEDLRKLFTIQVASDPELPETRLVEMVPRNKRIRAGFERLELWIDDESLYLVKMRITYPDGGSTKTIELSNLEANVPLADNEFRVEPETHKHHSP
jgi:outer membrane lipoprotein-sorting protein